MKIKFDKNFWWGTATSGPQSEGAFDKDNQSIMDYWFQKNPEDFFDYVGPNTASNMYYKFEKDVDIMSFLNLNSFRTSIQWSRLIKNFETGEISQKALKFYRNYFSKLKSKRIKTIVNLYHFDMPIYFQNIGGFENKKVIDKFVEYAKICFEKFSDLVDYWCTFNEPVVPIEGGYLYKWYYPKIVDFKRGIQAGYGTILAHAKTVNLFHKLFKGKENKKICIILNLTPTYPKDDSFRNVEAARIRDLLFNKSFLDPVTKNEFPIELVNLLKKHDLLPEFNQEEIDEIKKSKIDFLGVNYYQPCRVKARENPLNQLMPEMWFEPYDYPNKRINPSRGWEIYPKAIYDIAIDIKNNYNNINWFVSENGMGVQNENIHKNQKGFINDDYRIDFIKEHLYWLHKAINEGSNCFGYHLWTFIDCWSWANAYKNRYGIVELNLSNQKRTIKKSGYWFKYIISNDNQIYIDESKIKI